MLKGLDTSAIKYFTFEAPSTTLTHAGSHAAVDLSNFTFATLIVSTGSTAGVVVAVDVLRSSASDGTFHNFGASISTSIVGSLHVRSFVLGSSDVWYRTYHTQLGTGSPAMAVILQAQGTRAAPVNQVDKTTSYSVINSA